MSSSYHTLVKSIRGKGTSLADARKQASYEIKVNKWKKCRGVKKPPKKARSKPALAKPKRNKAILNKAYLTGVLQEAKHFTIGKNPRKVDIIRIVAIDHQISKAQASRELKPFFDKWKKRKAQKSLDEYSSD